ncbi:MAG: hypothetical protein RLZZ271_1102, partial [Pseudomonadota bacterium]
VIVITKNEEAVIARCLESVKFAREIIVVDGASMDRTAEIARSLGAAVYRHEDWPGFGPQKNIALQYATQPWVLSLDADEAVGNRLRCEIESVIRKNALQACQIPRSTMFCGQWIRHCGWTPDLVLRLFPREGSRFSDDIVHEHVISPHPGARLKSPILHWSYVRPEQYWAKLHTYSLAWARQRHSQGKTSSLGKALLSGLFAFFKSYVLRLGVLDGRAGLMVCLMQAQSAYGKHITLLWLTRLDRDRIAP